MPFDAGLAERVADQLSAIGERRTRQKNVFGGRGFLRGKRTFAVVWGDGLMLKLTPEDYPAALRERGVTPFAPEGERPMGSWVVVPMEELADDPELRAWLARALQSVR